MCAAVYRKCHLVKATEVTAGLAESNGSLLPGLWRHSLHVTCGLTACTPGSVLSSPTLGNEYRKTLPLPFTHRRRLVEMGHHLTSSSPSPVSYPLSSTSLLPSIPYLSLLFLSLSVNPATGMAPEDFWPCRRSSPIAFTRSWCLR